MWTLIGIILVFYLFFRLITQIGNTLPILELLLLIAGLQWIVGPINSFNSPVQHYKYYMYVDEPTYMSFVVPALLIFTVILLWSKQKVYTIDDSQFSQYSSYGKLILGIGILFDILSLFAPPSLRFFFFLVGQFKFVGAGILLFSPDKKDMVFFYGAIIYLLLRSLASALFHELLIWSVFMFMIWALKNKPTLKTKLGLIAVGFTAIVAIQMVKAPFRQALAGGYEGNKVALFLNILEQRWEGGYVEEESNQEELNVRLNQGWIISAIMDNTPRNQPFAEGATVKEAFSASLLPRFLDPNKKVAGGQENFELYTGLDLGDHTSMGMSIVGEAYANFGSEGGILFMAFWGGFLAFYWNKLIKFLPQHPLLLFFIPLIFLQVIKAETELVVVLNHLVKASVVVALFFLFSRKFLKWSI